MSTSLKPVILAAVAHPDDIEFLFAGTILLLRQAGCEIHLWNLSSGCLGSMTHPPEELARIRFAEARASARIAGATLHPPLFDDLDIFYDRPSLARVAATLRAIQPQIVLTHSLSDYMEDHQNVARLILSAAFGRSIPAMKTLPLAAPYTSPVRIYHAAPHGLCDGLGLPFQPDLLVNIESVIETKSRMLACHQSQKEWLEASQGMNAYAHEMVAMSKAIATGSSSFDLAEGWRRHAHLGFCAPDFHPLEDLLTPFIETTTAKA